MSAPSEMDCREIVELVTAYLEGALPPQERDRFDAHLQRCPACTAHVSRVRLTVASLGRLRPARDEDLSAEQGRIVELFRTRGLHRPAPRDRDVPLGLGNELVALGDHIAYFWETDRDFDASAGFIAAGASLGEACVLIGHDAANERVMASLDRLGVGVGALMREGQLLVSPVRPSADAIIGELDERLKDAVDRGMTAVRVLGNVCWGWGTPGFPSEREILKMEANVTTALERLPSIVMCAYDVSNLPGPMVLHGGLECHPLTLRRGCLRHNEHHVPSERFLEGLAGSSA